MNVTLKRILQNDGGTWGVMIFNGHIGCTTCELPWDDNHPMTSCIPAGTYHCIPHMSDAHPNTWELKSVPGRSSILIHEGNFPKDVKGCIAVGQGFSAASPMVINSLFTLQQLRDILPKEFDIEIINP